MSGEHWLPHDETGGAGAGILHCTPAEIDILAGPSHCDAVETINLGSGAEHCTPLSTPTLPAKEEVDTGETFPGN